MGRYGSYFFSVLLGTAYTAVKPIGGLLRKPATAAATVAALAALLLFVTSTVSAMLGLGGGSELEVRARPHPLNAASVCGVRGQRHARPGRRLRARGARSGSTPTLRC